jgi:hypothetical protein
VIGNIGLVTPWYQWPLMTQPTRALSYLVGNWFVMFAGLAALVFCFRRFARSLPETLIVSLYAVNMLQWVLTPQSCTPGHGDPDSPVPDAVALLWRASQRCVRPARTVCFCFAHMAHLGAPYDTMLGYWP